MSACTDSCDAEPSRRVAAWLAPERDQPEQRELIAQRGLGGIADRALMRGLCALMLKRLDSLYQAGKRGRAWRKYKKALATLDVVVTTVELGHGKRRNVLSDYTFAVRRSEEDPELLNIGKAYSGLTDVEIAEMTEWFRAHTLQEYAHGRVRIVEPTVVIEVTFDRVQPSNRHKSGYALRFPRIVRLRRDKSAHEIDTLETVRKLAGG